MRRRGECHSLLCAAACVCGTRLSERACDVAAGPATYELRAGCPLSASGAAVLSCENEVCVRHAQPLYWACDGPVSPLPPLPSHSLPIAGP